MIKRAIITGATGMIGSTLIEYLVEKGIEVLAICRPDTKRIDHVIIHPKVEICLASLGEYKDISSDKTYDVCFHFAWFGTEASSRQNVYIQNRNIQYTLDAVEMAKRMGCHSFIGGGSQAEYGRSKEKLNAKTAIQPETAYGVAKYSAGQMSLLLARQLGMRHIWTRILSVYGPRDGKETMITSTINQLLEGEVPKFTKAEQQWDYLYCTDAAKALYLIAEGGKKEHTYCIGSGIALPLECYIEQIRKAVNEKSQVAIGAKPYSEQQVMYLCADLEELTKDTGFLPEVSFQEGIRKTVDYCKKIRAFRGDEEND